MHGTTHLAYEFGAVLCRRYAAVRHALRLAVDVVVLLLVPEAPHASAAAERLFWAVAQARHPSAEVWGAWKHVRSMVDVGPVAPFLARAEMPR